MQLNQYSFSPKLFLSMVVLLTLTFFASACGYKLRGSGSVLPPDVQTVAIAVVENETTEPGLGADLQDALISEFERYGSVRVVDDIGAADAILRTTITNLDTTVRTVTGSTDVALEYDLRMMVRAELTRSNGQILYRNNALAATESFAGTGDVVVTSTPGFSQGAIDSSALGTLGTREISRGAQSETLEELIDEMSRRIYLEAVAADF